MEAPRANASETLIDRVEPGGAEIPARRKEERKSAEKPETEIGACGDDDEEKTKS